MAASVDPRRQGMLRLVRGSVLATAIAFIGCGAPAVAPTSSSGTDATGSPVASGGAGVGSSPVAPGGGVPTPGPAVGDVGPQQVSDRDYSSLSLVVDANGVPHAAAIHDGQVFYLTNASGDWTRERLTTSTQTRRRAIVDTDPSLAIDEDGSLWIAFTHNAGDPRGFGALPVGVLYTTNRSGSWSEPLEIVGEGAAQPAPVMGVGAHSPSLQVRQGRVHVAYQLGFGVDVLYGDERFPIRYATDASGEWTDERVVNHGTDPALALASDGTPRIVLGDDYGFLKNPEVRYAVGARATGSFDVERIPGTSWDHEYSFALDARADAHVALTAPYSDAPSVAVSRLVGGTWHEPSIVFPYGADSIAIATDAQSQEHMIVGSSVYDPELERYVGRGTYYATNRSGEYLVEQLSAEGASYVAIAMDTLGRAHMLYTGRLDGSVGLWYAVRSMASQRPPTDPAPLPSASAPSASPDGHEPFPTPTAPPGGLPPEPSATAPTDPQPLPTAPPVGPTPGWTPSPPPSIPVPSPVGSP